MYHITPVRGRSGATRLKPRAAPCWDVDEGRHHQTEEVTDISSVVEDRAAALLPARCPSWCCSSVCFSFGPPLFVSSCLSLSFEPFLSSLRFLIYEKRVSLSTLLIPSSDVLLPLRTPPKDLRLFFKAHAVYHSLTSDRDGRISRTFFSAKKKRFDLNSGKLFEDSWMHSVISAGDWRCNYLKSLTLPSVRRVTYSKHLKKSKTQRNSRGFMLARSTSTFSWCADIFHKSRCLIFISRYGKMMVKSPKLCCACRCAVEGSCHTLCLYSQMIPADARWHVMHAHAHSYIQCRCTQSLFLSSPLPLSRIVCCLSDISHSSTCHPLYIWLFLTSCSSFFLYIYIYLWYKSIQKSCFFYSSCSVLSVSPWRHLSLALASKPRQNETRRIKTVGYPECYWEEADVSLDLKRMNGFSK